SCPPLSVKPDSELSTVGSPIFECRPGLRLLEEFGGDKSAPVCMEDCLADGSLTVLETSTKIPADLLVTVAGGGLSSVTTADSDVSSTQTSQFDPDIQESTTTITTKFTATPTPITTDHTTSTKAT
ncbi:unnamed protein product, partial [Lymnaea stagnalis]